MSTAVAYEPMSPVEQARARALRPGRITYLPGSWDKRFARGLAVQAEQADPRISPKQREHLERLAHKYRRQLGTEQQVSTWRSSVVCCGRCDNYLRMRTVKVGTMVQGQAHCPVCGWPGEAAER